MFFHWSHFLKLLLFFLLPSWHSLMHIFQKNMDPKYKYSMLYTSPWCCRRQNSSSIMSHRICQTLMLLHSCCLTHIFLITFHFWSPHPCCHYPYRNVVRFSTYMVFFQTALLLFKSGEDASGVSQPHWCDTEHGSGTLPSSTVPQMAVIP